MTSKNNKPEVETEDNQKKVDVSSKPTESKSAQPSSKKTAEPVKPANDKAQDFAALEKQAKRGAKYGTVAIIIAIILSGGAAGYAYKMTQDYQATMGSVNNTVKSLEAKLSQSNSQLSSSQDKAEEAEKKALAAEKKAADVERRSEVELAQHQKSLESLQRAFAELKGRRTNDWLLAEADYLVKLTGRKLFLERDVVTATHLMESADQRIAALNDPSLVPLRKAMANDITTLKAVPLVDTAGLVLRLTTLQDKVDSLPLANAILPNAPDAEKAEVSNDINNWKDNLLTSLKSFSDNFITFRSRDGNVTPLLTPEQHFYLRENVKSQLSSAIKAVYDEQQELYVTALKTTLTWSKDYFSVESKDVADFDQMITELSEQTIQVDYPVKLETQSLLSDVINERLRREVTSLIKEDN
ncbi:uroporphyrinogen-III C-methyltransferase [Vibrio sp. WJH972]